MLRVDGHGAAVVSRDDDFWWRVHALSPQVARDRGWGRVLHRVFEVASMEGPIEVTLQDIRAFARAHSSQLAASDDWLDRWSNEWVPALQARPVDLLETPEGRERVLRTLQRAVYGVFA